MSELGLGALGGSHALPPGWAWTKIGGLQPEFQNGASSRGEAGGTPTIVLRLADVINGQISLAKPRRLLLSDRNREKYQAARGDILVIRVNGSKEITGQFILCNMDDLVYCDHFIRMRIAGDLGDPRFLAALGSSSLVRRQIEQSLVSTAGQNTINQSRLRSVVVPLPPRVEQERIVAVIEEQFSRIDVGMAALARVQRNVRRMRAALLQAAATGRLVPQHEEEGSGRDLLDLMLTDRPRKKAPAAASGHVMAVPESWAIASLEALTDPERPICYGILMPRIKEAGVVPYVEVKDLRAKRLSVAALHRTSRDLHEAFPRSILAPGDVVLAIRGSFDRALVVPEEVAGSNVSRDVARIAPLGGLDPDFLAAYLTSPPSLQYLRQRARGVAVKGVNLADIRCMPIPLPPIAEQRRISKELQRQSSILDDVLHTVEQVHARGGRLRSSMLAAAFSGKLAPQDPDDEPASLLLERIASERVASTGHRPSDRRARDKKATT